jgi:hypothetical protein
LYLHALAMNLLVRLRHTIAMPELAAPTACESGLPAEAQTGAERQRRFRLRRQRDPLGEGHPCTWRLLLIKVAAEVVVSARRILIRLSSSWPNLNWYHHVCERLGNLSSIAPTSG